MATKSIIYYTDNSLPDPIFNLCIKQLKSVAGDTPIISVSQKPIELGTNICLGEIGRSYKSYYTQILEGVKRVETEYVTTVEHDCLYSRDYFDFNISSDDTFYYNKNVWYVDWDSGRYAYYPRQVQSNMMCSTRLLKEAIDEKLAMVLSDYPSEGKAKYQCEPGVCDARPEFIQAKTDWCNRHNRQFRQFKSAAFSSPNSNLDIRYGGNFTRPGSYKVASHFTQVLPYWGEFKNFKNNLCQI